MVPTVGYYRQGALPLRRALGRVNKRRAEGVNRGVGRTVLISFIATCDQK